MKTSATLPRLIISCTILAATLLSLSGCTTTRSEHGVQIEQKRSYNPLNYIPW